MIGCSLRDKALKGILCLQHDVCLSQLGFHGRQHLMRWSRRGGGGRLDRAGPQVILSARCSGDAWRETFVCSKVKPVAVESAGTFQSTIAFFCSIHVPYLLPAMPSSSQYPNDSPARRHRRRRPHQRTDSSGDHLVRSRRDEDDLPLSPSKHRRHRSHQHGYTSRGVASEHSKSGQSGFSSTQLAQLDKLNRKLGWSEYDGIKRQQPVQEDEETRAEYDADREREALERQKARERRRQEHRERKRRRREDERVAETAAAGAERYTRVEEYSKPRRSKTETKDGNARSRVVSGQTLERQSRHYNEKESYRDDVRKRYGSGDSEDSAEADRRRKRRRNIFIGVGVTLLLLAIIIPVAVVVSKKNGTSTTAGGAPGSASQPSNSNLAGVSQSSIPQSAQGTYLDPFTWYDTTDFNVTYTDAKIGGLSIMGLNDTWDDGERANDQAPPLDQSWQYGTMPVRGVNIGGWLSIEPFITPSLFSGYNTHDNVIDEYTLTSKLGPSNAKSTLEQHYSSFVSEQTFADIQAAGFDHVRIPFSYWAVTTYAGDPYVPNVSWRYLLRAIEWARKHGLRINLDLHGAPGSQNGWNHSGRQGSIGWLNGTDGALNGQRTIDIHTQLSTFFAQPRYKNIIAMYGLVNEPRMIALDQATVIQWSQDAISAIRKSNYTGVVVFGDGFMGLDNWQGELQTDDNLLLDVHQYVIFNVEQIALNHHDKINFACGGWTQQALRSENKATGFGPTLCGEWSQADTDCATYLNNVGVGSRWEGTLNFASGLGGSNNQSVLTPTCPTQNSPQCQCSPANADPGSYSTQYKQWLLMFAEAQMHSFEQGWGWFYWTWQTETATQWSYKAALAANIMPKLAYQRDFNCNQSIPDFAGLGLPENY